MSHTEITVKAIQAVALTVVASLILWMSGLPTLFQSVEAASITSADDVLSNSAPLQSSVHTITFTLPNGMTVGQTFEIAFAGDFDSTSTPVTAGEVSITVNGAASSTATTTAAAGTWGITGIGSDTYTFETATDAGVASGSVIVITFGSETGNMFINPAATSSYPIDIGGGGSTMQDSGQVRVAIIDEVTVTADVDTSLTFSVEGVGSGATVNGSPTTTAAATTNTTVPFGTLVVGSSRTLAQRLHVATNAASGYTVTMETTQELQSAATGATIDGFVDGSYTTTPTSWQSPGGNINDTATYGHWAITSDDQNAGRAAEFGSNQWVSPSTTPIIVMGHTGVADGTTDDVGSTTVGFQIGITALQEAGDDYSTTIRYIATPTF
jgi:hypothetical protein